MKSIIYWKFDDAICCLRCYYDYVQTRAREGRSLRPVHLVVDGLGSILSGVEPVCVVCHLHCGTAEVEVISPPEWRGESESRGTRLGNLLHRALHNLMDEGQHLLGSDQLR